MGARQSYPSQPPAGARPAPGLGTAVPPRAAAGATAAGARAVLTACLEAAAAAPSVHNTQPWQFLPHPGAIDVYADPSRRLTVLDPRGREMVISIGAAILNLRVAVLNHGRVPQTRLLPAGDRSDLMARVTVGDYAGPDRTVRALAEAIPHRHTNRRPFTGVRIAGHILAELAAAARTEGARLRVLDGAERRAVLDLVRAAEHRLRADAGYRAELTDWTTVPPYRRDGVPRCAVGPWDALETLPLRDFGLAHPEEPRRRDRFEPDPTLVMISTGGDSAEQWLRAGQALERVLLTATVRSLAATPMSQPLEIPELRARLTDPRGAGHPQVILRVGYGRPSSPSPRRPLPELIRTPAPEALAAPWTASGAASDLSL
jgi:nitroreductase